MLTKRKAVQTTDLSFHQSGRPIITKLQVMKDKEMS